jgi:hypothetical protein
VQSGLADLGWEPGVVDDRWGPRTLKALSSLISADGVPKVSLIGTIPTIQPPKPALVTVPGTVTIRQGAAKVPVTGFMMHTSATGGNWWLGKTHRQMFDDVKSWHVTPVAKGGRGWSDIGYHGLLFPDGGFMKGREETTIGAGAVGYNTGWLHFCMIPIKTITALGFVTEFYTAAQVATMMQLIGDAGQRTPLKRLAGHNEVAAKLCPGFRVIDSDWTDLAVA